jgi:hypothetical protein
LIYPTAKMLFGGVDRRKNGFEWPEITHELRDVGTTEFAYIVAVGSIRVELQGGAVMMGFRRRLGVR